MTFIIWEVTVQDTDTDEIYRLGYKFDHSGMADGIGSIVEDCGGVEGAIAGQILEVLESE